MATRPHAVRERLRQYADRPEPIELPERKHRGAIIGALNKVLENEGADATFDRHLILGWLFGDGEPISSNDLTPQQWNGIKRWIGAKPVEAFGKTEWYNRDDFTLEARWVLVQAIADYHNVPLEEIQQKLGFDLDGMTIAALELGGGISMIDDEQVDIETVKIRKEELISHDDILEGLLNG